VLRPVVVWHVLRGVGAIVVPLPFPLHAEVSRPNPHVDAGIRSERHDRIVVMSKLEVWQVSAELCAVGAGPIEACRWDRNKLERGGR
jgi:hypothetical protein